MQLVKGQLLSAVIRLEHMNRTWNLLKCDQKDRTRKRPVWKNSHVRSGSLGTCLVDLLKEKVPFYITNCVRHHSSCSRAGLLSCSGWRDCFKPDTEQRRIARLAELLQFHPYINENVCTQHPWTTERLSDLKCSFSLLLSFQFQHWIHCKTPQTNVNIVKL